ncbi:MAG: MFS transporter [Clostridiales Family XIII bacterium]|jgi:MFS family permease|nr:MFS transporter [Clostridiales Family XIII bacterium]
MAQDTSQKGFYYGWWIVITGMCLMGVVFSAVVSLPGIFTAPVTTEWNVDVSVFTVHTTLAGLTGMLAALIVGKLLQKYNTKLLMACAAAVTAVCFLGYSFASQVWHFYVLSAIIGFASMFIIHIAVALLVTFWFGPKIRGKAMGIAMTGSGIGTMILNPVLAYINSTYGWRMSYRLLALLTLLLVPLILAIVVKSPQEKGIPQLGAVEGGATAQAAAKVGLTTKQAIGSPLFWIIFITFFLFSLTSLVFMYNAYLYFNAVGFDPVTGASLMSIAALAVIFGKLIVGVACDKWGARMGSTIAISLLIIGLLLLIGASQVPILAYFAVAVFGVGNALATVAVPLIVGELFGNRDYGSLVGICNMGCSLGASMGPLAGTLIFKVSGSYVGLWGTEIVLMAIMLLTMFLAFKVKPGVYAKVAAKEEGKTPA